MGQNVDPPGFVYKEEAEAFSKEKWDEYIEKHYKPFDAAKYDVVIYTDGSFSSKDKTMASYGLIIFFKDENKPYIESCTIQDVEGGKNIKSSHMMVTVKKESEKYPFKSQFGKSGLVFESNVTVGEL